MTTSIFIARLLAIVYLSIGVGALFNPDYLKKVVDDFSKSMSATYIGGLLALIMGFSIISVHSVWDGTWVVIISALGWAALVKGIMLLAFPNVMMRMAHYVYRKVNMNLYSIIVVLIGAFFGYQGFLA